VLSGETVRNQLLWSEAASCGASVTTILGHQLDFHQESYLILIFGVLLVLSAKRGKRVDLEPSFLVVISGSLTLIYNRLLPLFLFSASIYLVNWFERTVIARKLRLHTLRYAIVLLIFSTQLFITHRSGRAQIEPAFSLVVPPDRLLNFPAVAEALHGQGIRTYLDERTQLFSEDSSCEQGREIYRRFMTVKSLQIGWEELLDKEGFQAAILPENWALTQELIRKGWSKQGLRFFLSGRSSAEIGKEPLVYLLKSR